MSFALRVRGSRHVGVAAPPVRGGAGRDKGGQLARAVVPGCVSKEFAAFAAGRTAPVTNWLRALAAHAHEESGGPGVGVIGMCFTGGFALGMMVDDVVVAPVLSQPSLPIGLTARHCADIHLSGEDLARVRTEHRWRGSVCSGSASPGSPGAGTRFETLRRELGDAFIGVEIDSSRGNPWGIPAAAHSVVTEHLTHRARPITPPRSPSTRSSTSSGTSSSARADHPREIGRHRARGTSGRCQRPAPRRTTTRSSRV